VVQRAHTPHNNAARLKRRCVRTSGGEPRTYARAMAPLRPGGGLMASRGGGGGGTFDCKLPQVTTRDLRIFLAIALILSVLLSMNSSHHYHYKLRLNLPGMRRDSDDLGSSLAAGSGGGGGGRGGGGGAGGDNRVERDSAASSAAGGGEGHVEEGASLGSSSDAEEARQRREERRARRHEKRGAEASATEAAAAAGGDGRKLQPGEGAAVTHTRIFETGSMLRGGKATLEYAHMGRVGTPGYQVDVTDHAGCHQLVFLTVRPTRVEPLPGGVSDWLRGP
jgi:hypothetical protein